MVVVVVVVVVAYKKTRSGEVFSSPFALVFDEMRVRQVERARNASSGHVSVSCIV